MRVCVEFFDAALWTLLVATVTCSLGIVALMLT
jgi:hypothetical protein